MVPAFVTNGHDVSALWCGGSWVTYLRSLVGAIFIILPYITLAYFSIFPFFMMGVYVYGDCHGMVSCGSIESFIRFGSYLF